MSYHNNPNLMQDSLYFKISVDSWAESKTPERNHSANLIVSQSAKL